MRSDSQILYNLGVALPVGVDAHQPRALTDDAAIQGCFRIAEENGLTVKTALL